MGVLVASRRWPLRPSRANETSVSSQRNTWATDPIDYSNYGNKRSDYYSVDYFLLCSSHTWFQRIHSGGKTRPTGGNIQINRERLVSNHNQGVQLGACLAPHSVRQVSHAMTPWIPLESCHSPWLRSRTPLSPVMFPVLWVHKFEAPLGPYFPAVPHSLDDSWLLTTSGTWGNTWEDRAYHFKRFQPSNSTRLFFFT